ncbi:defensin Ec-AMP-D2-like [Pyrus ussuriensis x Pyrus communis]|uniref:Defensin Ec-AMP-D2-like n=1 Tax=Pyrus ussuriensis x Pyrus communis TaxID=2448454 RepID=A0A5N5GWY9_9ROSA|nr:defensin Ec-AMP-D2-like [Pyrus ussuriensis x Pyrus communis]
MERSMHLLPTISIMMKKKESRIQVKKRSRVKLVSLMVAEGRTCESQSNRFKGTCVSKSNCVAVCQTEGFRGGQCRGLCRRFFCTRHC